MKGLAVHKKVENWLFESIPMDNLALFRIIFGITALIQIFKLEPYLVQTLSQSEFFLKYDFFEWVTMPSPEVLQILLLTTKLAAIGIATGTFFRISSALYALGFGYIFLLDEAHYNNHYYLIALFAFLFVFSDAHAMFSIDRLIFKDKLAANRRPRIHLFAFQLMICIVYFYGAIAKLNADWLQGYPIRIWNEFKAGWMVGDFLNTEFAILGMSWTGIIIDFAAAALIFSRKLNKFILPFLTVFHILNHLTLNIGVFPFLMIGAYVLFFSPEFLARLRKKLFKGKESAREYSAKKLQRQILLYGFYVFFLLQLVIPTRAFFFPKPIEWYGNGWHFSWRMMLVDRTAALKYKIYFPDNGQAGYLDMQNYMCDWQFKILTKSPLQVLKFAHYVRDQALANGAQQPPEIYAYYWRQYNGRPFQQACDSTLNLSSVPYNALSSKSWVEPFQDLPKKKHNFSVLTEEEKRSLGIEPKQFDITSPEGQE